MAQNQRGLWRFPLGIWTSPDSFSPKEAASLVKLAIQNKKIVNFWCHLYEFRNPESLKSFFDPLLGYVQKSQENGLILADTMRNITSIISNE